MCNVCMVDVEMKADGWAGGRRGKKGVYEGRHTLKAPTEEEETCRLM